jgi:hypothetical protein
MNKENLLRYTKKLEKILISKENTIQALYKQSSREGLLCSISDAITFLLDDLRHNIFNIYLIYNSSLRNPADSNPAGDIRDRRAYDLIRSINFQQHILIGLNEKLKNGKWVQPCHGEYADINRNILQCVKQIQNNPLFPTGIKIELDLNEHIPALEFSDCDLFQIIYHSINCSIESSKDKEALEIRISTDMHDGNLLIRIIDNSDGTEPWSRGKAGRDAARPAERCRSIQFGLHACREIVNSYGGAIRFEKEYPWGTEVKIQLGITSQIKGSSGSENMI